MRSEILDTPSLIKELRKRLTRSTYLRNQNELEALNWEITVQSMDENTRNNGDVHGRL